MTKYKLSESESKFADIIWSNEPIKSGDLVNSCEREFNWKKSTTYTMLKRLIAKGVFQNEDGGVTSVISKEDFYSEQSKLYVEEQFNGSLPRFIAAFSRSNKLSGREIAELQKLIDDHKEE